jgi:3-dehydroquinate dehydratase-2
VEIHISNIFRRESFRQHSYVSAGATGIISGFGAHGYLLAIDAMVELTASNKDA